MPIFWDFLVFDYYYRRLLRRLYDVRFGVSADPPAELGLSYLFSDDLCIRRSCLSRLLSHSRSFCFSRSSSFYRVDHFFFQTSSLSSRPINLSSRDSYSSICALIWCSRPFMSDSTLVHDLEMSFFFCRSTPRCSCFDSTICLYFTRTVYCFF